MRLEETENARNALERAVELEPANAENWYNFACLKVLEGDEAGAAESPRPWQHKLADQGRL